jgi:hypothetical protein
MANGKIGIFVHGAHGDIALCTSVLKYKNILWPDKDIIWYCNMSPDKSTYLDMLKFNDAISEVRDWPKEDFRTLKDENGQLILNRRADFDSMKDLDNGYFPAPWAMLPNNSLNNVHYANIPKMVFGVDPSWEWHPYLGFSDEENEAAKEFHARLPHSKTIMLETQLRSAGNFNLSENVIRNIMASCRSKFGQCNFIFASIMDHAKFIDDIGVVSCSQFTVRQCALIHNYCNLFIGVTSGITMASSCWGNKPVPRVELCSNSTKSSIIANGSVNSFIGENMPLNIQNSGLENAVKEVLNKL